MEIVVRKAVFFDRDGVINKDHGYVGTRNRFEFLPKVPESLATLKKMGYLTILVTNQSGIARGMFTIEDFESLTEYMQHELKTYQAAFDGIYFCPHHPQAQIAAFRCDCSCRKPKPGMFFWAQKEFDIDLEHSIMVGDHSSDIEAAQSAGIKTLILVGDHLATDSHKVPQAQCFANLEQFVLSLSS